MAETNGIFISSGGGGSNSAPIEDWIIDYKTWGQNSYVYNDKEIWQQVINSRQAINDLAINGIAFEDNSQSPKVLAEVYGIGQKSLIASMADWNAVMNSSTAWNAVLNSSTAMNAVLNSSTAMNAVLNSSTAMNAVLNSSTAMNAVANSSTAMNAVLNSSTAMNAVANSSTACNTLYAKAYKLSGSSNSYSGKFILLEISSGNSYNTNSYGFVRLQDGSTPNWNDYKTKFSFFRKYPQYGTYIRNDTESDDYVMIYKIS